MKTKENINLTQVSDAPIIGNTYYLDLTGETTGVFVGPVPGYEHLEDLVGYEMQGHMSGYATDKNNIAAFPVSYRPYELCKETPKISALLLKDLPKGTFFRRKNGAKKTYTRGAYRGRTMGYECQNWDDVNDYIYLKGTTKVFTNFEF